MGPWLRNQLESARRELRAFTFPNTSRFIGGQMAGILINTPKMKIIPQGTHAVIDYVHAATNFAAAAAFRKNRAASTAALGFGLAVLGNALMTDYKLGVFRAYSFKVHGMLDYGVAAASAVLATVPGIKGTRSAAYFAGQGAGEAMIAGMTDYSDNTGARRLDHMSESSWRNDFETRWTSETAMPRLVGKRRAS
jgi:hypothetical protein